MDKSSLIKAEKNQEAIIVMLFLIPSSDLLLAVYTMGNVDLSRLGGYLSFLEIALPREFWLWNMSLLLVMTVQALKLFHVYGARNVALFWNSLPVRDEIVIASELFFIVVVQPVVTLLATMLSHQAYLRPRDRFWDIPVPKIDSAFDNLFGKRQTISPLASP